MIVLDIFFEFISIYKEKAAPREGAAFWGEREILITP